MRIASDRGVAPRLHHADAETAVVIMDRVGAPLGRSGPGDPRRLERIAATLRRLHEGPAFPRTDFSATCFASSEAQMIARSGEGFPRRSPARWRRSRRASRATRRRLLATTISTPTTCWRRTSGSSSWTGRSRARGSVHRSRAARGVRVSAARAARGAARGVPRAAPERRRGRARGGGARGGAGGLCGGLLHGAVVLRSAAIARGAPIVLGAPRHARGVTRAGRPRRRGGGAPAGDAKESASDAVASAKACLAAGGRS